MVLGQLGHGSELPGLEPRQLSVLIGASGGRAPRTQSGGAALGHPVAAHRRRSAVPRLPETRRPEGAESSAHRRIPDGPLRTLFDDGNRAADTEARLSPTTETVP